MVVKSLDAVEALKRKGSVYERFGVHPIINGNGTQTILGGSIMEPEVAEAMAEASRTMVVLEELNEAAGQLIAEHTGAEAGLVTSGAAAGLTLQAAAVVAGEDPERIALLPEAAHDRNQIVIKSSHDSEFTQAWRQGGARLVWVGNEETCHDWEIESAISGETVALGFIASRWHPDSFEGLSKFVEIAHGHGLPLLVDAAAMLPPAENLRRFIEYGADLVSYSGGKAIKAPQSTGILCGRADLIAAAKLNASPHYSIGRPMKVAREEIVGLMAALELYVLRDHEADMRRWFSEGRTIVDAVIEIPGVTATIEQDDWLRPVPEVSIAFTSEWLVRSSEEIVNALAEGDPPIIIEAGRRDDEDLFINPHGLMPGEAELIAERLRAELEAG
ncbi:MAG: aminotransferase class V-fold PLP-dependent enzyme [Dehalococcoidia bacterium]|nr:aminotransferase class V-fold PLP-dependent enzyme [Dehalococcoidia bacterium]